MDACFLSDFFIAGTSLTVHKSQKTLSDFSLSPPKSEQFQSKAV